MSTTAGFGSDGPSNDYQPSGSEHHATNPDKFVLGTRRPSPSTEDQTSQQQQQHGERHHARGGSGKLPPAGQVKNNGKDKALENLSRDLAHLLNKTDISDCYLNVKGVYMAVHKCILAARSSAFSAVVAGDYNRLTEQTRGQLETMTHKDKLVIIINKTEPEIMKQVVIFLYTAKCDLNDGNAFALLDAAGRYDIKDLKVHTGEYLSSRVDANNVITLLKAAYKYDNLMLKQRCIEYFIQHAKAIMAMHEPWKHFAEENQEIVAELLHWTVNKESFFAEKPRWQSSSQW